MLFFVSKNLAICSREIPNDKTLKSPCHGPLTIDKKMSDLMHVILILRVMTIYPTVPDYTATMAQHISALHARSL